MKLQFLGAAREVGRSCIRVQTGEIDVLLDCGVKIANGDTIPAGMPTTCDAVVVTHCHLDHSGALPVFFEHCEKRTPYFCTPPTEPLVTMLLEDSLRIAEKKKRKPYFSPNTLRHMERYCHAIGYNRPFDFFDGTALELYDAGHVLGSAQVLLTPPKGQSEKPLLYSGDLKLAQSRMHAGAVIPKTEIGTLIVESTYADREHPDRKALERKFCGEIKAAAQDGYTVLIPAFAVGRAQELLMILKENDVKVPVYIDGMAQAATELSMEFSSYIRDGRGFKDAVKRAHFVSAQKRRKLGAESPVAILATAGMLEGGPMLGYISRLSKKGKYKIFLTGFQLPKTNGRKLLETGSIKLDGEQFKVDAEVQSYDFSAHAGRSELFDYVRKCNPERVFCVHGDEPVAEGFAKELSEKEGFDAVAPSTNQEVEC